MSGSLISEIRNEFSNGTTVNRLLLINIAVFAVVILITFADWASHQGHATGAWATQFTHYFSISSDWRVVLRHIWSPFTCLFLHADFSHILFNMIALMMFGNIVGDLIGDRRVFPIYLLGGLLGNLFFFISVNLIRFDGGLVHEALGASGGIMALAGAAVTLAPNFKVRLLLFGSVALKYIVVFMILADLVGIADNYNTGGHFAHIGGFVFGWFFVHRLQNGKDIAASLSNISDQIKSLFVRDSRRQTKGSAGTKEPVFKVSKGGRQTAHQTRLSRQERLDSILDKIRLQGMASLTEEEKKFLESLKD